MWSAFAIPALWLTRGGVALDTDSALRLTQVRDLLHGQGWFDTMQYRLNTPYGMPMHWSRLVDAPLALLMLVSESFALRAWPLLLLLAALILIGRIAFVLGGAGARITALLLTFLCTAIYPLFTPGDIDHHGLQLVLMLAALLGVVERRPVFAAIAVALGLGVGLESLPYILAACLAAALWLQDDVRAARCFGFVLAGTALLLLAATTAHGYRAHPVCDTYSLFYAVLLAAGGIGVAAISFAARGRLWALCGLALLLLGLAAAMNPGCLAGPYGGMDAKVKTIFLDRINEARPVWSFWFLSPAQVIGGYCYALFAFGMGFFAAPSRARTIVLGFAALGLGVAALQYRAAPFAIGFALPLLAAGLTRLLAGRIVALAAAIIFASSGAVTMAAVLIEGQNRVAQRAVTFHAQEDCGGADAMALLRSQPPGQVAAFMDQGPAILATTRDAAIAGPYHRDAAGILDTFAIFTGASPRAILQKRGIAYLMTCRAAPDWDYFRVRGGLVAQLARGQMPDWLVPLGHTSTVTLYRIKSVGESRSDQN